MVRAFTNIFPYITVTRTVSLTSSVFIAIAFGSEFDLQLTACAVFTLSILYHRKCVSGVDCHAYKVFDSSPPYSSSLLLGLYSYDGVRLCGCVIL
jgi:hypothetical protein